MGMITSISSFFLSFASLTCWLTKLVISAMTGSKRVCMSSLKDVLENQRIENEI